MAQSKLHADETGAHDGVTRSPPSTSAVTAIDAEAGVHLRRGRRTGCAVDLDVEKTSGFLSI
jgi:hypothetical protein